MEVLREQVRAFFRLPRTMPWSERMNSQTTVRITNETKNGTSSMSRKKFFLLPPWNAIQ